MPINVTGARCTNVIHNTFYHMRFDERQVPQSNTSFFFVIFFVVSIKATALTVEWEIVILMSPLHFSRQRFLCCRTGGQTICVILPALGCHNDKHQDIRFDRPFCSFWSSGLICQMASIS